MRDTPRIDHPWHEQRRVLFHLGLPIFLETFLRMLINNVNVFMISKLSDETVGAVGEANQILNFLLMVYACIAFGTAVLISQNLEPDAAMWRWIRPTRPSCCPRQRG